MEELPYNSDKKMLLYKKSSVENALVISKRRNEYKFTRKGTELKVR